MAQEHKPHKLRSSHIQVSKGHQLSLARFIDFVFFLALERIIKCSY